MTREELEKTHTEYSTWLNEWNFYVRSYHGGKLYREGNYLLKHQCESDNTYKRRKQTAYFYNYCQPIVDIYGSFLYKKSPVRSYGNLKSALFDSFWTDVDFWGTNYDQFIRDAHRLAAIYGRVSIIVDKPAISGLTQADALANDLRPYFAMFSPENVLDWQYIRLPNGRPMLADFKVCEGRDNKGAPSVFRIWTRKGWELWQLPEDKKEKPNLLNEGEHALGEVPVVNFYNKRSGIPFIGISDLRDIADINKNIYALCSDATEIIENTAFPMLIMAMAKGGADETQEVGPKNILEFDPDLPNSRPGWLEPPHSSLAEIRLWIEQNANEMARIALLGGMRNIETSTQPWSSVAIESLAHQLYAALVEKAENAEQAEYELLNLWAKWEGKEFNGVIQYTREFETRDMSTVLQGTITAKTAGILSKTFERERQKEAVKAMLPGIEEDMRDKIFGEIEKAEVVLGEGEEEGEVVPVEKKEKEEING